MKKSYIILITLSFYMFNGCVKMKNSALANVSKNNIKPDSAVILLSTENKDTRSIIGTRQVVFKNLDDGSEEMLNLDRPNHNYHSGKLKPGKYKFLQWSYYICSYAYNSGECIKWGINKGKIVNLNSNIFTIEKDDVLYLGHAIVDTKNNTLTITNNYNSDIKTYRNNLHELKEREIKNIH